MTTKLAVAVAVAANSAANNESWLKLGSNVNYRFSAILDVNGGSFAYSPKEEDAAVVDGDGQMRTATTSAGCK